MSELESPENRSAKKIQINETAPDRREKQDDIILACHKDCTVSRWSRCYISPTESKSSPATVVPSKSKKWTCCLKGLFSKSPKATPPCKVDSKAPLTQENPSEQSFLYATDSSDSSISECSCCHCKEAKFEAEHDENTEDPPQTEKNSAHVSKIRICARIPVEQESSTVVQANNDLKEVRVPYEIPIFEKLTKYSCNFEDPIQTTDDTAVKPRLCTLEAAPIPESQLELSSIVQIEYIPTDTKPSAEKGCNTLICPKYQSRPQLKTPKRDPRVKSVACLEECYKSKLLEAPPAITITKQPHTEQLLSSCVCTENVSTQCFPPACTCKSNPQGSPNYIPCPINCCESKSTNAPPPCSLECCEQKPICPIECMRSIKRSSKPLMNSSAVGSKPSLEKEKTPSNRETNIGDPPCADPKCVKDSTKLPQERSERLDKSTTPCLECRENVSEHHVDKDVSDKIKSDNDNDTTGRSTGTSVQKSEVQVSEKYVCLKCNKLTETCVCNDDLQTSTNSNSRSKYSSSDTEKPIAGHEDQRPSSDDTQNVDKTSKSTECICCKCDLPPTKCNCGKNNVSTEKTDIKSTENVKSKEPTSALNDVVDKNVPKDICFKCGRSISKCICRDRENCDKTVAPTKTANNDVSTLQLYKCCDCGHSFQDCKCSIDIIDEIHQKGSTKTSSKNSDAKCKRPCCGRPVDECKCPMTTNEKHTNDNENTNKTISTTENRCCSCEIPVEVLYDKLLTINNQLPAEDRQISTDNSSTQQSDSTVDKLNDTLSPIDDDSLREEHGIRSTETDEIDNPDNSSSKNSEYAEVNDANENENIKSQSNKENKCCSCESPVEKLDEGTVTINDDSLHNEVQITPEINDDIDDPDKSSSNKSDRDCECPKCCKLDKDSKYGTATEEKNTNGNGKIKSVLPIEKNHCSCGALVEKVDANLDTAHGDVHKTAHQIMSHINDRIAGSHATNKSSDTECECPQCCKYGTAKEEENTNGNEGIKSPIEKKYCSCGISVEKIDDKSTSVNDDEDRPAIINEDSDDSTCDSLDTVCECPRCCKLVDDSKYGTATEQKNTNGNDPDDKKLHDNSSAVDDTHLTSVVPDKTAGIGSKCGYKCYNNLADNVAATNENNRSGNNYIQCPSTRKEKCCVCEKSVQKLDDKLVTLIDLHRGDPSFSKDQKIISLFVKTDYVHYEKSDDDIRMEKGEDKLLSQKDFISNNRLFENSKTLAKDHQCTRMIAENNFIDYPSQQREASNGDIYASSKDEQAFNYKCYKCGKFFKECECKLLYNNFFAHKILGSGINQLGSLMSIYKCHKCGKVKAECECVRNIFKAGIKDYTEWDVRTNDWESLLPQLNKSGHDCNCKPVVYKNDNVYENIEDECPMCHAKFSRNQDNVHDSMQHSIRYQDTKNKRIRYHVPTENYECKLGTSIGSKFLYNLSKNQIKAILKYYKHIDISESQAILEPDDPDYTETPIFLEQICFDCHLPVSECKCQLVASEEDVTPKINRKKIKKKSKNDNGKLSSKEPSRKYVCVECKRSIDKSSYKPISDKRQMLNQSMFQQLICVNCGNSPQYCTCMRIAQNMREFDQHQPSNQRISVNYTTSFNKTQNIHEPLNFYNGKNTYPCECKSSGSRCPCRNSAFVNDRDYNLQQDTFPNKDDRSILTKNKTNSTIRDEYRLRSGNTTRNLQKSFYKNVDVSKTRDSFLDHSWCPDYIPTRRADILFSQKHLCDSTKASVSDTHVILLNNDIQPVCDFCKGYSSSKTPQTYERKCIPNQSSKITTNSNVLRNTAIRKKTRLHTKHKTKDTSKNVQPIKKNNKMRHLPRSPTSIISPTYLSSLRDNAAKNRNKKNTHDASSSFSTGGGVFNEMKSCKFCKKTNIDHTNQSITRSNELKRCNSFCRSIKYYKVNTN